MRRNNTPYRIKHWRDGIGRWYVRRFLAPQFDSLGSLPEVAHPRHLVIFGGHIHLGKHTHIICAADNAVRLTTWPDKQHTGEIRIGDFCLLSPGVRISSNRAIHIGNNVMLAANVSISDSDWHGIYNRVRPFRCSKPVIIDDNVWLGERVIVNKGVHIGENSVIGAGAVVTRNIPANVVAAGNPARIIKAINPNRRMLKREKLFEQADHYFHQQQALDRYLLGNNGWLNWLRSLIKPGPQD